MEQPPVQRLKIKIGDAEFDAEGPSALVTEQYAQFLLAIQAVAVARASATPHRETPTTVPAANSPASQDTVVTASATPPSEEMLARVFRRDGDGLSLLALPTGPNGDAEGLIMLLYGYQRLCNQTAVTAVALSQAARQSGISLSRLDRTLGSQTEFIMAAGAHRGRRYSLNNRGVRRAEELVRQLVE